MPQLHFYGYGYLNIRGRVVLLWSIDVELLFGLVQVFVPGYILEF